MHFHQISLRDPTLNFPFRSWVPPGTWQTPMAPHRLGAWMAEWPVYGTATLSNRLPQQGSAGWGRGPGTALSWDPWMAKKWENLGKIMDKIWENHGKNNWNEFVLSHPLFHFKIHGKSMPVKTVQIFLENIIHWANHLTVDFHVRNQWSSGVFALFWGAKLSQEHQRYWLVNLGHCHGKVEWWCQKTITGDWG